MVGAEIRRGPRRGQLMSGLEWSAIAGLGAVGALLRFAVSAWVTNYPRALMIVVVNSVGAFGAGWGVAADWGVWGTLLAAGLWGSLTTFSTLAVDVVSVSGPKKVRAGVTLLSLHLIGGVLGVWLGIVVGS